VTIVKSNHVKNDRKKYLVSYQKMKLEWVRIVSRPLQYEQQNYVSMVLIRNVGISRIRTDGEKRCHLHNEEENEIHILLKLNGSQIWQEKFWNIKLLNVNEIVVHKKIISCTKITNNKFSNISLHIKMQVGKTKWQKQCKV
jgi:hypothetical protein